MLERKNVFVSIILLIVLVITLVAVLLFMPSFSKGDIYEYYNVWKKDEINILFKDTAIEAGAKVLVENEEILFPFNFVKDYLDELAFWDEKSNKLIVTTADKVIKMQTDDLSYFVNSSKMDLNFPIIYKDGSAYIPQSTLKMLYDINVNYDKGTNVVIVDFKDKEIVNATVEKSFAYLRFEASSKSKIIRKLEKNEKLRVFDEKIGKFVKVRTSDGLVGYINEKKISDSKKETVVARVPESKVNPLWGPDSGKLNLTWDQIEIADGNRTEAKRQRHKGLDVLSPTWFTIDQIDGTVSNIADKSYVDWAHENGYQVWALIKDDFYDRDLTYSILSDTEKREKIIKQILYFAEIYDLDGINVDFEGITEKTSEFYVQFMRELAPLLREAGIVSSVDVFVPAAHNTHYKRATVGEVVDYMIIMTYDEHYGYGENSNGAGPVASIDWVREGVLNTLKEVDANKIILGIPFYNRVWFVDPNNPDYPIRIENHSLDRGKEIFMNNNVEYSWDEDLAYNYGEYLDPEKPEENGDVLLRRLWLEDEKSISEKLKLVEEYDLAGVASWSRALANNNIWDIFNNYLKEPYK